MAAWRRIVLKLTVVGIVLVVGALAVGVGYVVVQQEKPLEL